MALNRLTDVVENFEVGVKPHAETEMRALPLRARGSRRKLAPRKLTVVSAALIAGVLAAAAVAFWTTSGTGSATAGVGTINAPTNIVAKAANNSMSSGASPVTVTWTAPSGGVTPTGYKVIRHSGATATDASCGVVTATTCTDSGVPDGTYTYTVRSLYSSSWTADSAGSNSLQIVNDNTAPAITLSFPTNGSSYNIVNYGGTCFPVGICGTATDATGVARVQVSIKRVSDGFYWGGSSFVNSGSSELFYDASLLSPNGTSTGWDYGFPRPADGSYTVHVLATDTVGNAPAAGSYSATATFTLDTAAPVVSLTAPANNSATRNNKPIFSGAAGTASGDQPGITVTVYNGTGTGGTVARTLSASASAGAWSITPATALADGVYTARAMQSDAAGNTGVSGANTFTVDTAAPAGSFTFPASNGSYNTSGWNAGCASAGLCGTASDVSGSGVPAGGVTVSIQQMANGESWDGSSSSFKPGSLRINTATMSGTTWSYAFSAASFPADGIYQVSGTITDAAGNTFSLGTRSITFDRLAPTVTLTAPVNGSRTKIVAPTFAGAAGTASGDLAGITVRIYTGSSATGTPVQTLSTNAASGAWSVAASAALAEGTYTAQASQSDAAGNTATSGASTFTVDTTAPTVTVTAPTAGSTTANQTRTISGAAGTVSGDLSAITVKVYNGSGTGGSVAQTLSATASAGTWSATPSTLAAGTYTIQASQSDSAGNTGTSSAVTFTVDISAPTIGSKPAAKSASTTAAFTFSHAVYGSFQCKLDTGSFAACNSGSVSYSGLSNTSHTLTVQALDAQNFATASATYTWTVDTSAPVINTSPANPSASASPSFTFAQANYTNLQCAIDGAAFAACTSATSQSYSSLAEGSHTFQVKAVDADGISTLTASSNWTQRTTAPTISSNPSNPSANKTPTFSFSETGYTSFACSVDGATFATCTSPFTTATLGNSSHTFAVRAIDANGLATANQTSTWTVDNSAPTLGAKPAGTSAATAPTFSFTQSSYTSFECKLDAGSFVACNSGSVSYSALATGSHTFSVHAKSSDGATTADQVYNWAINTTAPTLGTTPTNPSASSAPAFAFNHTVAAYSFECQLDGAGFGACTSPKGYSGLADGAHTFLVRAVDANGVATGNTSYAWTIRTSSPTISSNPSNPSANKTPTFSFSETGYTSFQCKLDGAAFAACTSGSAIATQADGSHTFSVRALDGNSNPTAAASYTWTINSSAPGISSVSGMTANGTYAATSAAFNFSHSIYTSFQCFLDATSSAVCANGKTFSALADGSHTVTGTGRDADNIPTSNGTFAWTVKNAAPTLTAQPANPTNTTSATFSFNETPYTLFQCQLDGASFTACNTGTQSYSSLSGGPAADGVSHTFNVHAVDSLNASTSDRNVTWTVDTVAPTGVSATTCVVTGGTGNRVLGNSSGGAGNATTDSTSVTLKIFNGPGVGGTVFQSGISVTRSGATWTYSGSTKLTNGNSYTLQATQSDAAGNTTVGTTVCTFTA